MNIYGNFEAFPLNSVLFGLNSVLCQAFVELHRFVDGFWVEWIISTVFFGSPEFDKHPSGW